MTFFAPFCIPFIVGSIFMFATLITKWGLWLHRLPKEDKRLILRNIFTTKTPRAIWEVVREALLHVKIWRVNPVLGYMHTSLAFGWFLLIVVGWCETVAHLGFKYVPLQGHVFFKYFATSLEHKPVFDLLMDALLLIVLSGVALAWIKRLSSKRMGMRRAAKHVLGDRVAMTALWFIFPARLIAESVTCAIYGGGGFLVGSLGELINEHLQLMPMLTVESVAWWTYSSLLGLFFVALPFSRYMHIMTEIPLIFLRAYSLKSSDKESSFDNFQVEACSRCGICIDPCQLQSSVGINDVQSVYFLRDRRYNRLKDSVSDNCLMCGRCESVCPVGIDLNTLRLNSREKSHSLPNERRYDYLRGVDKSSGSGTVGYFAGCMTLLTPRTMHSMATIFERAGEDVWWADREGGMCCGRPLKLSGEVDAARNMMRHNEELFRKHSITTLVTSCPICLKVFREEYQLKGIEVLHHSEYILRLIQSGRLKCTPTQTKYTYHDPCELGRGCGIYDEPRAVVEAVGELIEPSQTKDSALCCGSSLANTAITDAGQVKIAGDVTDTLQATDAQVIVTSCPLCKKALARTATIKVQDLSEIIAESSR